MPPIIYRELAWAFLIIIGVLIIRPDGIVLCTACVLAFNKLAGAVLVATGIIGFVYGRGEKVIAPSAK